MVLNRSSPRFTYNCWFMTTAFYYPTPPNYPLLRYLPQIYVLYFIATISYFVALTPCICEVLQSYWLRGIIMPYSPAYSQPDPLGQINVWAWRRPINVWAHQARKSSGPYTRTGLLGSDGLRGPMVVRAQHSKGPDGRLAWWQGGLIITSEPIGI